MVINYNVYLTRQVAAMHKVLQVHLADPELALCRPSCSAHNECCLFIQSRVQLCIAPVTTSLHSIQTNKAHVLASVLRFE